MTGTGKEDLGEDGKLEMAAGGMSDTFPEYMRGDRKLGMAAGGMSEDEARLLEGLHGIKELSQDLTLRQIY